MTENMAFVVLWISTKIVALILLGLLIWWAAANNQLKKDDRIRWLAIKKTDHDF